MGPFDGLIASSTCLNRVKLLTSAGLEKLLVGEISGISSDCNILSGGPCYVDARASLYHVWKLMLESRLCEQLWMHVCDPFPVRHSRTFLRTLNNAEWKGFMPFSANLPPPYVRVNCKDSTLYHTGMIKKMVHQVIKGHCHKSVQLQGDSLPEIMQRRGHLPVCPTLMVNIDNDMCEVLANASGDIGERPWTTASALDARISPAAVSAIANKIDLIQRIRNNSITAIWDPLCHNGSLLLELYSIFRGHRLRAVDHVYPMSNFPLNVRNVYEDAYESCAPNGYSGAPLKLLGTDVFDKHVADAKACLGRYLNSPIHSHKRKQNKFTSSEGGEHAESDPDAENSAPSTESADGVTLTFSPQPMEEVDVSCGNTMVLTNLYYGDKGRRKEFLEAHRRFEEVLMRSPRALLQNVYVVATEGLRTRSRFSWEPELHFNNGGVLVSLLKLRGVKT
ncbi:hypothetical protein, conserved [Babesia bigemina]|uniref:Uncharacterized protein n=1 Tax=Babesia bigemina TaxID=5866 RepID=A0A061DCD2_BABBI|nr:hypothetical protein, conserved [Babesia bigemina]CDR96644.1 hypothetical protein, conserved [Babesia bigemina]|eukprot:XP_012768830.1 hypothetical protein, conserved [Babesia bigemina]